MKGKNKGLQVQTPTRQNKVAENTPIVYTAISYINAGLSVVPAVSSTKYTPPGFQWKKYQTEKMSTKNVDTHFKNADGIAIICGGISGGLEVIDFDNHFGDAKQNFTRFCNIKELKPILKDMVAEKTPGGGYHVYFRCEHPNHSKKIAMRWMEKEKRPDAIIELKGEGGLILCAPSIGYELIGKTTFDNIKFIEEEEKKILYKYMYSFNEYVKPDELYHHEVHNSGQNRPGYEYNNNPKSVEESKALLIRAGWKTTDGVYWTRPGKKEGVSATFGKCKAGPIPLFYVFSTNAAPFENGESYSPFQVKALYTNNGDFSACTRDLTSREDILELTPEAKLQKSIKDAEIDILEDYNEPPKILTIGGEIALTKSNFMAVTGKAKSRKTFFSILLIVALVTNSIIYDIGGHLEEDKRTVLFFDTEQSPYHVNKFAKRVIKQSGLSGNEIKSHFRVFALRAYPTKERTEIVRYIVENIPNVGCVVIDGLRDLVSDINDQNQAVEIIDYLMSWTLKRDIGLITVLHQNKTDLNPRGHLGTELINKAETTISITKDKNDEDVSIVSAEYTRNRPFDDFAFRINNDGLPEICDMPKKQSAGRKRIEPTNFHKDKHIDILQKVFSGSSCLTYSGFYRTVKLRFSEAGIQFGDNKAKDFVKYYELKGFVNVTQNGNGGRKNYSLKDEYLLNYISSLV